MSLGTILGAVLDLKGDLAARFSEQASFVPAAIQTVLRQLFAAQSVHGQLATVDPQARPALRTVHYRLLENPFTIAFNTNTLSDKFPQLQATPFMEGCYFDVARELQLRWRGPVTWVDAKSPTHQELRHAMWGLMREELRRGYWCDAKQIDYRPSLGNPLLVQGVDIAQPSPTFVTVICLPTTWDVYQRGGSGVFDGNRQRYVWSQADWKAEAVSIFSSQPL